MKNLLDILENKARERPSHIFVTGDFGKKRIVYTLHQIWEKSANIGSALRARGFEKGDRIAIFSGNRPDWGIALFSIFYCGAIAVPIDSKLTADELGYILKHSGAKALFCSQKLLPVVRETELPIGVFLLDPEGETGAGHENRKVSSPVEGEEDLESLERLGGRNRALPVETGKEDLAFIVYTSGTTGRPKGVMLSHGNILANLQMVEEIFCRHFKGGRFLSILPLNHTFEITGGFFTPLYLGASIFYIESLQKETILASMKEFRPTVMLTVPTFLNFLYRGIEEKLKSLPFPLRVIFKALGALSSIFRRLGLHLERRFYKPVHKGFGGELRYVVSGAAPLNPELIGKFDRMGFHVLEGYGLTETSPIISVNHVEDKRPGSVGRPLSGISVKIVNEEGDPAGTGEIAVSGANVMKGYYGDPVETSRVLREGWLYTGDIGRLDREGFLFISGRCKDVIVSQTGKKIFPEEVEDALSASPYIKELCVIGKKRALGEDVYAIIVIDEKKLRDKGIKREEYYDFYNREIELRVKRLSEYKKVRGFLLTETELPKTTTLKVKRCEVSRLVESDMIPSIEKPRDSEHLDDPVFLKLQKLLSAKLAVPEKLVMPWTCFYEELGIDSLMRLELFLDVEREFDVPLQDERILSFKTVEDVVRYLKEPAESSKEDVEIPDVGPMLAKSLYKDFMRGAFHLFYRLFASLFMRLSVSGRENIPPHPFIIAPNHASLLDAPSVFCAFPLKMLGDIYTPASADFIPRNSIIIHLADIFMNIFPFYRKADYLKSLKICIELLNRGKSIILFPEGFMSRDGKLQELKPGIARIALESGAPIVPVYIEGTFNAMPPGQYYPKPGKVSVRIGKAFRADHLSSTGGESPTGDSFHDATPEETLIRIIKRLEAEIIKLQTGSAAKES